MRASPSQASQGSHLASTDRRSRAALVALVALTLTAFVWLVLTLAAAAF